MGRPAWYDIEMRGKRLEAISRQMNTKAWEFLRKNDIESAWAYIDRMIKIENIMQPYVEQMTGVKKLLARAERKLETSVYS